jgi:hypothetical protein
MAWWLRPCGEVQKVVRSNFTLKIHHEKILKFKNLMTCITSTNDQQYYILK